MLPRPTATAPRRLLEAATPSAVLAVGAGVVILKVTAGVVANYPSYVPPDFTRGFLFGREATFFGWYRWAFGLHLLAGPLALVLGLFLMSPNARRHFPALHRALGRVQVGVVVLGLAPSGLAMATRPAAGPVAGVGLGLLAVLTGSTAMLGWRAAVRHRLAEHRRWMVRYFVLLASAVVLRLGVGLATVVGCTGAWVDVVAAWACWVGPLAAFEVRERWASSARRRGGGGRRRDRVGPAGRLGVDGR